MVGSKFGCFFTHSEGTFIYFTLMSLKFLIFKAPFCPPSSPYLCTNVFGCEEMLGEKGRKQRLRKALQISLFYHFLCFWLYL